MKTKISSLVITSIVFTCMLAFSTIYAQSPSASLEASSKETYKVISVPSENGSYTISPTIGNDNTVPAGTVLTVKAKPQKGYSLDAIYYTVKGGMWGTTSVESFAPKMKITVTKDMQVGATFIPSSLVDNVKVIRDVVYAKPGVKPLKYDIYTPEGAKMLPAIVIIHGGGWSSNNEDIMRGLAREIVKGGKYVVFSIDYRWMNKLDGDAQPNNMHELIEDVFGAIAHIQENATAYGADPNRIAVTGDSAGGHLSAAAATLSPFIGEGGFAVQEGVYEFLPSYIPKHKSIEEVKNEITKAVKGVAPSYGPFEASVFKDLLEQKDQEYWDAISPAAHVPEAKERLLPHFIIRGTEDPIVKNEMVQPYVELLKTKGQKVKYIQIDGAGHAFFDWKPDAKTRATFLELGVPYAAQMQAFFDSIFYKR